MKKIFLLLVDISGYTRFMRLHKMSLIHAEGIIAQLLESVIQTSEFPLIAHELEGDAVSFYAASDGSSEMANDISQQILQLFNAFKVKEAELLSDCSLCVCEACTNVDKLKLKAVVHHGEAVFSKVGQFQKVAGVDVILAHRLLKNSIEEDEYILATSAFDELIGGFGTLDPYPRQERCDGIGPVDVVVYYPGSSTIDNPPIKRSAFKKLRMAMKLDLYLVKRLLMSSSKNYRNLQRDG
ncbi:MAG: DUF2652 domain-containing protein [Planctomycetota bacterium]